VLLFDLNTQQKKFSYEGRCDFRKPKKDR